MQTKHHDIIHDFFHNFSRILIFIPVIIVIIAILLKPSKSDNPVPGIIPTSQNIQISPSPILQNKNEINLQGPSVCVFNSKDASWSAIIQNRMIWARAVEKIKTTDYLLKNDCFYSWEKNKYTGEKICGIGQFLTIGESLFNSGLLNEDMFYSLLGQSKIAIPILPQYKDLQRIITSCKPSKAVSLNQFELPKQVLFKSK